MTIIAATTAHTLSNKEMQSDGDRIDRGHLVIQDSTAYEYIGRPTHARQILWLHLPIDISELLKGPGKMLTIAADLQDTCDAALTAPAQMNQESNPASLMDVANQRRKRTLQSQGEKWWHMWNKYTMNVHEAESACRNQNMTLPQPAGNDHSYQVSLRDFMQARNITHVLIHSDHSLKDNLNRLPPHAMTPSEAFPGSANNEVYRYDVGKRDWVTSKYSLAEYDDDPEITYAYFPEGHIKGYVSPTSKHTTNDKLRDLGLTDREIANEVHLPQSYVICEKPSQPKPTRKNTKETVEQMLKRSENSARHGAIQLCYNTVDHIEVIATKQHIRAITELQQHNIAVDDGRSQPRRKRNNGTQFEEKRKKRFAVGLLAKGAMTLGGIVTKRRFGSKMIPYLSGFSGIKNLLPQKRRAFPLLKKFLPLASNPLPMALGIAGLGFNMWRHYRTNRKFAEQRQLIKNNQENIKQQATDLDIVTLAVTENEQSLRLLEKEMFNVQDTLQDVQNQMNTMASTSLLQTIIIQVAQETRAIEADMNSQYVALLEVLTSAAANTIPGIFLPEITKKAHQLGLAENGLMPNPDRAVGVGPLVQNGKLDVFANFVTGDREWEMYQIYSLPQFAEGMSYKRTLAFEYALVGQGQGQFIPLTSDEANDCKVGACEPTGVVRRMKDDPCTICVIAMRKPHKDCPVTVGEATPFLQSTIKGLIFSVPKETMGRLVCENSNYTKIGIDKALTLKGMGVYDIPTGCDFRIHEPEVIVLGPPESRHESLSSGPTTKQGSEKKDVPALASAIQERRAIRRSQEFLKNAFTASKTKISLITTAAIIIACLVGALILMATGKIAWLFILHRRVVRFVAKTKQNVNIGKEALKKGMTSMAKQADGVYRFLYDRDRVNGYLRGATDRLPLHTHISMVNLSDGANEHLLLGPQGPLDAPTEARTPLYPGLYITPTAQDASCPGTDISWTYKKETQPEPPPQK